MKRDETACLGQTDANENHNSKTSRAYSYTKVLDGRKTPIRGLWQRNGNYYARLSVEEDNGTKTPKWCPLPAKTAAEAKVEFRKLLTERDHGQLRHIGEAPKLVDFIPKYLAQVAANKRPATAAKEKSTLAMWIKHCGELRLNQIRPSHILSFQQKRKTEGHAPRTLNLDVIALRNVFKRARLERYIKANPCIEIPWLKTETSARSLITAADFDKLCQSAMEVSKNGQQLVDYLRLMAYCGARRDETLRLCWQDADFGKRILTIGSDGDTKNHEARRVDFNPKLEAHLKDMAFRKAPDSKWLFPSPQRGTADDHAKTFMESLRLARKAAGMPGFGFHDCRHYFISFCVMSGIDFMTIARWVGHKDGGVLIGKVYGHLSNEHAQLQASRLNFGPIVLEKESAA